MIQGRNYLIFKILLNREYRPMLKTILCLGIKIFLKLESAGSNITSDRLNRTV